MKIIFMGSAPLSCASLDALMLEKDVEVVLAVTQPDRPKGRNLVMSPCPLKKFAERRGVRVISPDKLGAEDTVEELYGLSPDYFVLVAYGKILKPEILDIPRKGCINLHTSLLPKYRGAAPIQWAIASGETAAGVTTMHVSEKMDEGDIIYQEEEPVLKEDTGGSLHDRLAVRGAKLLAKTMKDLDAGIAPRVAQDHSKATYAPKLSKKDGRIDWQETADVLYNKVRAFNPWPVMWCRSGKAVAKKEDCIIRIYSAEVIEGCCEPGRIAAPGPDGLDIGTGRGILRITELQIEGGKRMDAGTFLRGHFLEEGSYFE